MITTDVPAYLLLGRLGDIINALPILKRQSEKYGCPIPMIVQQRYVSLLSGCSYVWAESWPGDFWHTLQEATAWAHTLYPNLVVLQTGGSKDGKPMFYERRARSFCHEAYEIAGFKPGLPLVFDQRDKAREKALIERSTGNTSRPILLYNLTGISSPFPAAQQVQLALEKWGKVFYLVDTSKLKAEFFYDLLGLYDMAAGLVTIDTATLHLAPASTVPYIAFIQDTKGPWFASVPRGQCILQIGYTKATSEVLHNRIARLAAKKLVTHLWPKHKASGDTLRRNAMAAYTWHLQQWQECGLDENDTGRWVADSPTRRLPFIKDMIDRACQEKADSHIIVFTNADSCVADHAMSESFWKLSEPGVEACYSNRRDFDKIKHPLNSAQVRAGELYPGNDWFAFRVGWWKANRDSYPDMLVGAEAWDCLLRLLMEETHKGKQIRFDSFIYHERHYSLVYNDAANRLSLPTQRHNRKLATAFIKARGLNPEDYGLSQPDEPQFLASNPKALKAALTPA